MEDKNLVTVKSNEKLIDLFDEIAPYWRMVISVYFSRVGFGRFIN